MIQPNIKDYLLYLDDMDATEDKKEEFIRGVWNLMEAEVDKVFGIHSVQLALDEKLKDE